MVVNDRSYTENLPKYPKSHRIFKLQSSRQATASKNCRNCSTQGVPCAKPWTSFNCSSEKFVRIKSSTLDSLDTRTSAWSWLGHVGTSSKVMTKCWATCFQCDCEAPLWTCAPGHSSEFCVHQLLVFEGLQVSGHLPSLGFEKRDWSLPCSMGSSQHELTDFYHLLSLPTSVFGYGHRLGKLSLNPSSDFGYTGAWDLRSLQEGTKRGKAHDEALVTLPVVLH